MNTSECIELLQLILNCMDDKLQGERDKMTKIIDLKPSFFKFVLKTAINLLTVEAEPVRHGQWVFGSSKTSCWMTCSICRKSQSGQTATFSYCPNCGARMDGGGDHGEKK